MVENLQTVVLAGGLATRLRPLTEHIPKALVPVAGRPFIDWLLLWVAQQQLRDVLVLTGYRGEQLSAHVGDGTRYGLRVAYHEDGGALLGTAGALRVALDLLAPVFLCLNGDTLCNIEVAKFAHAFTASRADLMLAVGHPHTGHGRANVAADGARVVSYDKSGRDPRCTLRHLGPALLRASLLETFPEGLAADFGELVAKTQSAGRVTAWLSEAPTFDMGTPSGLERLEGFVRHLFPPGGSPSG